MAKQVLNPRTQRWIKAGGVLYERLQREGVVFAHKRIAKKAKEKASYFTPGAPINERQRKYCRCVAHVAAQQSDECLRDLAAGARPQLGDDCRSPYAICTRSTRRTGSGECLQHYDLPNMPPVEVRALALLKTGKADAGTLALKAVRAKAKRKVQTKK